MPRVLDAKPVKRTRRRKKWLPLAVGPAAVAGVAVALILFLGGPRSTPTKAVAPPAVEETREPIPPVPPPKEGKPDEPAKPKKEKPPKTTEPKKPPEEKPKEKASEPLAWEARLEQVKKSVAALAKEEQFGKAVAALDALTRDSDVAELKMAVEDAKRALREQAAEAFKKVHGVAISLARGGKFDEARERLRRVVQKFGTPREVKAARATLDALGEHQANLVTLTKLAQKASAAAQAAARGATRLADLVKALGPIEELMATWKLGEAAAELAKLKFDNQAASALVARRKGALDALIALRARMIQAIKTARPPLRKSDVRIKGFNGDLVDADANGITMVMMIGGRKKVEKRPWSKLRDVAVEAFAKRVAKRESGADQLATALWLHLIGTDESKKKAGKYLAKAAVLGEKTDALADVGEAAARAEREAHAARALAQGIKLHVERQHKGAAAALADYKKKFADTEHYADHKKLLDTALAFKPFSPAAPSPAKAPPKKPPPKKPGPKKPGPKPPKKPPAPKQPIQRAAQELYNKAAAAFNIRRYDECKKLLEELKEKFPKTPLLKDAKLKPSVPAMVRAIAARGQRLRVSRSAKEGAFRSLRKALAAIEKPNATIELEPGLHRGGVTIAGRNSRGMILRGVGERRPRLDGGKDRDTILNFPADCKDIWIEGLEFANAETAIFVGERSSAAVRDCIALQKVDRALEKAPGASVTITRSALRIDALSKVAARASAFHCAEEALVESADLTACILVGRDVKLRGGTLSDCLILGSMTVGDNTKLSHVTLVGTLTVPEGASGIRITDSILESLEVQEPKERAKDKKREPAVTLEHTALYRQTRRLPKRLVKTEEVDPRAKVRFAKPGVGDFRLAKASRIRVKSSDKAPLGCGFPPEMIDLLKLAKRYPALLRPPAPSRKRKR